MCFITAVSVIADDGVICTIYTEYIAAVAETRSSPLPQPINYGHTGDKKGKIFLLTTYFDAHCLKITQNVAFFKNSPKLTIFSIFNELLFSQNINVACFALNVE